MKDRFKAWIYQDKRQVEKAGADKAPYYVGWRDPEGRRHCQSCGSGSIGKLAAKKKRDKLHVELASGTYEDNAKGKLSWVEFRTQYENQILKGMEGRNRENAELAFRHFERLMNPQKMSAITTLAIATFIAKRREELAYKNANAKKISPATVNRELRYIRAAIGKAVKWDYLAKMPDIGFLKVPGKIPTYVTPEHFAKLYAACDSAKWPKDQPYPAADWWRGLFMFAYMTGWRIGSMLALKRENVDLEGCTALSLAKDNKGKRDQKIPLHLVVVEHLRRLPGFSPAMFPWNYRRETLFAHFKAIQKAADVKADGPKGHYGFHDLRRAFATMNADKLTADALQALMQHKDYTTTQRYINMSRQLNPAVQSLYVPDVSLKITQQG